MASKSSTYDSNESQSRVGRFGRGFWKLFSIQITRKDTFEKRMDLKFKN